MTLFDLGREVRLWSNFELRKSTNGSHLVNFRGYASVTGHQYEVAGGPDLGGWVETMSKGAFKRTLGTGENRALLYAHDNAQVLATTRAGSLTMLEDNVGLLVDAALNTRVGWISDLVEQIEDGTVDEMSIGFRARTQEWSPYFDERQVLEAQIFESTITWAGANGATVGAIERSKNVIAEARTRTPGRSRVQLAAAAAAASLRIA